MKSYSEKKTKIVATIGPATESEKILEKLFTNGVNVMRMNFSHNTHEWHQATLNRARKIEKEKGFFVTYLQDLSGPKIRTGKLKDEKVQLKKGKKLILTTKDILGDENLITINYKKLPQDVKRGDIIKLEDGKKSLLVEKITKTEIHTKILVGGMLGENKGINVPGVHLSISSLTEKDKKDVLFGIKNKVDYIALSFVQSEKDILHLRKILDKHKCKAEIIAKIETGPAVENFDKILKFVDGIMVARGDLAIEVGAENVPLIQKNIIYKCNKVGKPVITATQMLDSMEHSPVPTRAEVSDIANAIFDGTDAIMLSGETTIGKFPIEAVKTMVSIVKKTEPYTENRDFEFIKPMKIDDAITRSSMHISREIEAQKMMCFTKSGSTARMLARFRPETAIFAISPNEKTLKKINLSYGCIPYLCKEEKDGEKAIKKIKDELINKKLIKKGEKMIITMGYPFGIPRTTNKIIITEV